MKVDFTTVLKDQDDLPIKDMLAMQTNGGVEVLLTLGRAVSHALMVQSQSEPEISGDEKFFRGMLAVSTRDAPEVDLKAEDIVLIKKQLAKLYSPIIVYRAYLLLEGKSA